MADVKDILGLPRQGPGAVGVQDDKAKSARTSKAMKVPAGMSREAFALLDHTHPIMPSVLGALTKKAQAAKSKIRSQWRVSLE
jgi:hypothetical protein